MNFLIRATPSKATEKPLRMLCLSKFLLLKNWILMALSCLHLKFLEKEDQEPNGSRVGEKESEVRVESALCAPLVGTTEEDAQMLCEIHRCTFILPSSCLYILHRECINSMNKTWRTLVFQLFHPNVNMFKFAGIHFCKWCLLQDYRRPFIHSTWSKWR